MATNITQFIPFVAPEVIGCPSIMVRAKIAQAVIELCKQAPIWRYEYPDIATIVGTRDYTLSPPADSQVADILDVNFNDDQLDPTSSNELKSMYTNWRIEVDYPLYYLRLVDTVLSIVPTPNLAGTISMLVSLKPTPGITTVEDFLFNEHFEIIAAGAKYYLMSIPVQKWSNPSMADYYLRIFNNGIAMARVQFAQGNVNAAIRVKPCV